MPARTAGRTPTTSSCCIRRLSRGRTPSCAEKRRWRAKPSKAQPPSSARGLGTVATLYVCARAANASERIDIARSRHQNERDTALLCQRRRARGRPRQMVGAGRGRTQLDASPRPPTIKRCSPSRLPVPRALRARADVCARQDAAMTIAIATTWTPARRPLLLRDAHRHNAGQQYGRPG